LLIVGLLALSLPLRAILTPSVTAQDGEFEKKFAHFLQKAEDVGRFAKLPGQCTLECGRLFFVQLTSGVGLLRGILAGFLSETRHRNQCGRPSLMKRACRAASLVLTALGKPETRWTTAQLAPLRRGFFLPPWPLSRCLV
jgi:hypothetical protein